MKRRISIGVFLGLILCVVVLEGCERKKEPDADEYRIFYLDSEETELVEEYCEAGDGKKESQTEGQIDEILKLLREEPDTIEYKSVFIGDVEIKDWELKGTKLLLNFNERYYSLDRVSELLLRAAVVQSLAQVPGVDYVGFLVENKPLTDKDEHETGYMRAEDFVQNTGSSLHSYQTAELTLYFSNGEGDELTKEEVSVRYNSNMSVEKLVVERLIKGPSAKESKPVIPAETKVLSVAVKDDVCYVNFDEGFLNMVEKVKPKVTIYALVNSIVDSGSAEQVQILVNGENNVTYQETIDLSKPFEKDLGMIEVKEE